MNKLITVFIIVTSIFLFGFSFFDKEDQMFERAFNCYSKQEDLKNALNGMGWADAIVSLHVGWNELFDRNSKEAYVMQIAEYDGIVNVNTALMIYDKERRKQITVLAIVPTTFIDKQYCKQVYYYDRYANDPQFNALISRHLNNYLKKR